MNKINLNFRKVQQRVATAALNAGRSERDVRIVAVSKTHPIERIKDLYNLGQNVFGENRIQEAILKINALKHLSDIEWHMVGHLQSNKAKLAVRYFKLIHSVDSLKIASLINKYAAQSAKIQHILLQVNVSGESSKFGLNPQHVEDVAIHVASLSNVKLRGLMTIPPFFPNPESSRQYFAKLTSIFNYLKNKYPNSLGEMDILSMGMSNDFEIAIEEGSTMVRIGTAIFGAREEYK